ncbi:MAG: sulfatase-like hydrolase/transferase [Planctomycetes bacterium]|nr:sulfatase-like hydrolase/transferase [Planctomycetota bacterium]
MSLSLPSAALLAGVLGSLLLQGAPARPPNILLIFADDQPYKTLGCYPEAPRWVRTPNIDKLAAAGVRFERAYLGSWCMPSRATLLTGRLPHAIESMRMDGEYPGSSYDPAKAPFWPAVFRRNGYHTAQIGKWHTGVDTGFGRDWDYQVVWNRPKLPKNAGAYYTGQILAVNGVEREAPEPEYSTDAYTRWAGDYIRGKTRDAGKPWYLWLCYAAVHGPTTPADRHKGSYRGEPAPLPADVFGPRPGKPAYLDKVQAWGRGPDGGPLLIDKAPRKSNFDQQTSGLSLQDWIRQMNECTRALDEGVGRVIDALRESGQLENTLVVYTADQGYAMGEHGLNSKLAPYDASYASPLIVSRPGTLPQGKVCSRSVNSADLVATFFAAAGLKLPWAMHGYDMMPLLLDPLNGAWEHPTLMTHTGRHYGSNTNDLSHAANEEQGVPWWAMLRDGRFKYVRYLIPGEVEELYDLQADPDELKNLAPDPAQAERLERLRARTVEELRRTEAGFAGALPAPSTMSGKR